MTDSNYTRAEELLAELQKFVEDSKDYYNRSVSWNIADFEWRANQLVDGDWKKVYNEEEFGTALYSMMENHDATVGITWDTIDHYLDEYCKHENSKKT